MSQVHTDLIKDRMKTHIVKHITAHGLRFVPLARLSNTIWENSALMRVSMIISRYNSQIG